MTAEQRRAAAERFRRTGQRPVVANPSTASHAVLASDFKDLEWYYLYNESQWGPLTTKKLLVALAGYPEPPKVLVRNGTAREWHPAGSVPQLAAKLPLTGSRPTLPAPGLNPRDRVQIVGPSPLMVFDPIREMGAMTLEKLGYAVGAIGVVTFWCCARSYDSDVVRLGMGAGVIIFLAGIGLVAFDVNKRGG